MKKRWLCTLLALLLTVSAFAGCSGGADASSSSNAGGQETSRDADDPYAEHLSFEIFSIDGAEEMLDYPLVAEACEKFNIDFTVQLVAWDNWDDVTRTLAATDSFPEVIAWYNLNYAEYVEWAQEGIFKALPSDLSAYPNLEALTEKYTIFESCSWTATCMRSRKSRTTTRTTSTTPTCSPTAATGPMRWASTTRRCRT